MHLVPPRDGHIRKWHLRAQVPFLNGTGCHVLAAAGNASRAGMPAGAQFSQVIAKCIKNFRPGAGKGLQFSDAQVPAEEAQQAPPKQPVSARRADGSHMCQYATFPEGRGAHTATFRKVTYMYATFSEGRGTRTATLRKGGMCIWCPRGTATLANGTLGHRCHF